MVSGIEGSIVSEMEEMEKHCWEMLRVRCVWLRRTDCCMALWGVC